MAPIPKPVDRLYSIYGIGKKLKFLSAESELAFSDPPREGTACALMFELEKRLKKNKRGIRRGFFKKGG